MKARGTRPILDRACDALRIPDERRHKLRIAAAAMALSEDDPSHVYLVVGEVVTMGLAAHQDFMATVPTQLRVAADNAAGTVEARLDTTITRVAAQTGDQVKASVGAVMETFLQRERRSSWPLFAWGLGIVMLLSGALGWTLADRDQVRASVFWSDLMASAQADDWQRIIELNSGFPREFSACAADGTRVYATNGGLACRTAVWLRIPTEANLPPLQLFLRNPALVLGSSIYILLGALGCVLGAASVAILFWWRGRR